MITKRLQISCDEAGHTGPDLLRTDQRFFAYGSVAISDDEAKEIIQKIVRDHPVQMPELKAAKLIRSVQGQTIISEIVKAVDGRFSSSVTDNCAGIDLYQGRRTAPPPPSCGPRR